MFCPKCGTNVSADAVYCERCGANLLSEKGNGSDKEKKSKNTVFIVIAVVVILSVVTALIIFGMNGGNKPSDQTENEVLTEEKAENYEEPKFENMILSMSDSDKRALNIFFSNFCEAFFADYSKENRDDANLISFAFRHNSLNNSKEVIWTSDKAGISGKTVNKTLDKYMGINVPLKSVDHSDGYSWTYEDGTFWAPAGDGESHDYFAIVSDMYDMGNGTFQAKYDVFYAGYDELTKECYSYTTDYANENCEFVYSATALVKPKTYDGKDTYELISLHEN